MAFNTPITGAQYWAQHKNHYQTPANINRPLNPSVPQFQPNGTEMELYRTHPPTPPSSNPTTLADMMQMQRLVLDNHFTHTKDVTSLERRTKKNSDDIQNITACVRNDMCTLQDQIHDLKQEITSHKEQNGSITRRSRAGSGYDSHRRAH